MSAENLRAIDGIQQVLYHVPPVVLVPITELPSTFHALSVGITAFQIRPSAWRVLVGSMDRMKGAAICLDCPLGTFQNTTGAVTINSCLDCTAGKFSSANGSAECLQCPKVTIKVLMVKVNVSSVKMKGADTNDKCT